ncbi:MAG: VOC family protein [Alphaproteobacteria bacterium]|nr:VOC family protein [Alphaproteobacteria bacterium]
MPDTITADENPSAAADAALRVVGLNHVVLRVASLERAIGFYRDVLGCHVERRLDEPKLVQLRAGAQMIDLMPTAPGEAPGRNMDHFAVRVAQLEPSAIAAHLARHGIAAGEVRRRYGAEGYGSSIYINDPDGNVVELKGPPEQA